MLSIAIIEDETAAAEMLISFINRYGKENGEEYGIVRYETAVAFLDNYKPVYDIVFMDIVLPKLNGMEAARKLREIDKSVTLIFVTNMVNFAVKGYEVGALDFIVKPIVYDLFLMKMDKAVDVVKNRNCPNIVIQYDGAIKVMPLSDITYIEVIRNTIIYHTTQGIYRLRSSMKEVENILSNENFVRCNVCYLVNLRYVKEVKGDTVTVDKDHLHISRARKKQFMEALTDYLGRGN